MHNKIKETICRQQNPLLREKTAHWHSPQDFFLLISISLWATLDVYSKNSSLITYIMIRRPILGAFHSIHIISSFVFMEMKMQILSFKIRWDATQRYQFFSLKDLKIYALLSSEWRKIVVSTAVYIVVFALSVCVWGVTSKSEAKRWHTNHCRRSWSHDSKKCALHALHQKLTNIFLGTSGAQKYLLNNKQIQNAFFNIMANCLQPNQTGWYAMTPRCVVVVCTAALSQNILSTAK